jgi:predicted transcriptional regulator
VLHKITAEQIKAGRSLIGLSQEQLALKAGVGVGTLRRIEGGHVDEAKIGTIGRLVGALEAVGVEFVGGGVRKKPEDAL